MGETAIRAEHLGKRFALGESRRPGHLRESLARAFSRGGPRSPDHVWALRDVSFEVAEGEVVGIIGRNGAGKSTLLRILSRITAPSEGRAEIHGRIGSLLEVGTGFHPDLTGRENVQLNGAILGMTAAEIARKFDAIVEFADVTDFLDTPVKRYSSGMRMRLAFAVAAHLDPDILVIDEVLAVGDIAFQNRCLGKMDEVARSGRTVLFVSHNMAAVEGLCGRAILLDGGRIASSGDVRQVIARYLADARAPRTNAGPLAESADGRLVVRSIDLLDLDDNPLGAVQTGQSFALRLGISARERLRNASLQIALNDPLGARVALLGSQFAGEPLEIPRGDSQVVCLVQDLPLVPSLYPLELKVIEGGETVIFERRLADLLVEGGDFFKSGRLPPEGWSGRCLLRQAWTLLPDETAGDAGCPVDPPDGSNPCE